MARPRKVTPAEGHRLWDSLLDVYSNPKNSILDDSEKIRLAGVVGERDIGIAYSVIRNKEFREMAETCCDIGKNALKAWAAKINDGKDFKSISLALSKFVKMDMSDKAIDDKRVSPMNVDDLVEKSYEELVRLDNDLMKRLSNKGEDARINRNSKKR